MTTNPLGAMCVTCIFWEPSRSYSDRRTGRPLGQCRAHAPAVLGQEDRPITRWPVTADDSWCGDHTSRT